MNKKCVIEKIKSTKGNEIRFWRVSHCERDIVQDCRMAGGAEGKVFASFCCSVGRFQITNHCATCLQNKGVKFGKSAALFQR